jgi:hypothetical protein
VAKQSLDATTVSKDQEIASLHRTIKWAKIAQQRCLEQQTATVLGERVGKKVRGENKQRSRLVTVKQGQPSWNAATWLASLPLVSILSDALLSQSTIPIAQRGGKVDEVVRIRALRDDQINAAVDAAARTYKEELRRGVSNLRKEEHVDAGQLNDKFVADGSCFTFEFGGMAQYHGGLEAMIGEIAMIVP